MVDDASEAGAWNNKYTHTQTHIAYWKWPTLFVVNINTRMTCPVEKNVLVRKKVITKLEVISFSRAAFQSLYIAQCDKITLRSLGFYVEQHRLAV